MLASSRSSAQGACSTSYSNSSLASSRVLAHPHHRSRCSSRGPRQQAPAVCHVAYRERDHVMAASAVQQPLPQQLPRDTTDSANGNGSISTSSSATAATAGARQYGVTSQGNITCDRVGVLLLNLGGPETLKDVQPFLYNLFADPDIIRLPPGAMFLQPLLAQAISAMRAPKSAEGYRAIGGGSPLRRITEEQAAAIEKSLKTKGIDARVYVGMRYWHPYTEEAMEEIKRDGVTRLVILPLYPQFSISTSGSSLRLLEGLFKQDPELRQLSHTVIPSWYQRKGYVSAMVDLITQELEKFADRPNVEIFFSAHGVPKSYVEEAGDPYKEEMEECVALIMKELRSRGHNNHYTLAYQSRVGPAEWLKPYTDESIRHLGDSGVKSLLAVPISFVSEHIETLEEIDMEYRELAEEHGIKHWGRVPALNTNEAFIDDLANAVMEALPYVGCMAGPTDSLVPMGDIESLIATYDRDRRALPSPVVMWEWGWTKSAETWNGRIAMIALISIVMLELTTGQSFIRNVLSLD